MFGVGGLGSGVPLPSTGAHGDGGDEALHDVRAPRLLGDLADYLGFAIIAAIMCYFATIT